MAFESSGRECGESTVRLGMASVTVVPTAYSFCRQGRVPVLDSTLALRIIDLPTTWTITRLWKRKPKPLYEQGCILLPHLAGLFVVGILHVISSAVLGSGQAATVLVLPSLWEPSRG